MVATNAAVRFLLDGQTVTAPPLPATTTVLEYLREIAGRTGTKEGCAEGDCGACTVVLGRPRDGRIVYAAINSCIRFLPTIDGCELITVESLQQPDGALHPVQQAMVDGHASQCGFCTPGFVMSLFAHWQRHAAPEREAIVDALSGNLCRCTGYRPIVDAATAAYALAEPSRWSRRFAQSAERRAGLAAIGREQALALPGFKAPRRIDELAADYEAAPESLLLAGGTDIGLWVTLAQRELPPILYLGEVAELETIERSAGGLEIGAAVTLAEAWDAIVAEHPAFAELARRFASPPVRNSGTLAGNIANASPIGDAMPALLALDARLRLRCGQRERVLPLAHFYRGYRQTALERGEFISRLIVPAARPGWRYAAYKLAKRIDQDISAVCAAFALRLDEGVVAELRLAYGGMAATPARAAAAEAALLGRRWDATAVDRAAAQLAEDFRPLDDHRASAAYRLRTAGNLLRRFLLHTTGAPGPLRTAEALQDCADPGR